MNMNRIQRLIPAVLAVFGLMALAGTVVAAGKANHHDAKQLLGDKAKSDGHHVIHTKGKYTTSVETRNGKISALKVKHSEKGDIPVKKYKTEHKMAQAATGHVVYASFGSAQAEDMGTVYIGYAYTNDEGDQEIYWFPAEMIEDGTTGAVEYVPLNNG
jgi:hypothetical protein